MTTPPARTLTVRCPLPPVELSPNGRFDRRAKAAAIAAYRDCCMGLAREAMGYGYGPPMRRAVLSLRFVYGGKPAAPRTVGGYRPKDVDNAIASIKGLIDGIVRAGALRDDRGECLELGRCRIEGMRTRGTDGEVIAVLTEQEALP